MIDASGCLVTPGLINTHHHLYQNLPRAFAPALGGDLFEWLRTLYPVWSRLDEEAAYVSAWSVCASWRWAVAPPAPITCTSIRAAPAT